ncbi:MAG: phosphate ABC transporter permease subunit PstC [bacterium]|nr:phosphate ABC transporter permease subunit PstC [bacterium]
MQIRKIKDIIASRVMWILTCSAASIIFIIAVGLYLKSAPILKLKPISALLFSSSWQPMRAEFGFFPFIMGTVWVTAVAMLIAVPLCLLTAIYLAEYAKRRTREVVKPVLDVLAGISPVVYGVWGMILIVPTVEVNLRPFLESAVGFIPLFKSSNPTGFSILSGGIVLSIMIIPVIISVSEEVMRAVPFEVREASFALGATKWQTVKHIVFRKAFPGILAAIILGLSRAFGETMAVLMVVGNVAQVPKSVFDAAYPLPALIANNYGEMMSIPLYDSALMFGALILLAVTILFNVVAWSILLRIQRELV